MFKMQSMSYLGALALVLTAGACAQGGPEEGQGGASPECVSGERGPCPCSGGVDGVVFCDDSGFWRNVCQCPMGQEDIDNDRDNPNPDPAPQPDSEPDAQPDPDPTPQPDPDPEPQPDPERYCYDEPFNDGADLGPARNRMGSNWQEAAIQAYDIRWPGGASLIRSDTSLLSQFGEPGSWSNLMESLGTVIHEGTHVYDYGHADWETTMAYYVHADLTIITPWVDGFYRSELLQDLPDRSSSLYSDLYFNGEQGARGFSELMDEQNCYINDMAAAAAVGDQITSLGWSARDGALAFLWYMQLYLRRARTHHPEVYSRLQGDDSIQELVLTNWLKAHFWLQFSDRYSNQGVRDREIRPHLYEPQNLDEMALYLGFRVDDTHCIPD